MAVARPDGVRARRRAGRGSTSGPTAAMLAAAIGVAAVVTLLAGVLPVLRGCGADLVGDAGAGRPRQRRGDEGRRIRQASIVAQLALSFALLVSAALVDPDVRHAARGRSGVRRGRPDDAVVPRAAGALRRCRPARRAGRSRARRDRARPGVRAVGIAQALPFAPGVVWLQALTRDDPRGRRQPRGAAARALQRRQRRLRRGARRPAEGGTDLRRHRHRRQRAGRGHQRGAGPPLLPRPGSDRSVALGRPRAGAADAAAADASSAWSATRAGAASTNRPAPKRGCRTRSRPAPKTSCGRCTSCSTPTGDAGRRCRRCGRRSPAPTPTCH